MENTPFHRETLARIGLLRDQTAYENLSFIAKSAASNKSS